MNGQAAITELLSLSARIGRDPLLVQASSGNTSVKLGGTLWIKASGKWLAHAAERDTLVPVNLEELRRCLRRNEEFSGDGMSPRGEHLRASIETAMHGVLPHRIVIHVHSVNTIAWAVRRDGAARMAERLAGLHWSWIPYVASGLPLARAIERAIESAPETNVFILANHGLVVCTEDCGSAESLLAKVESRLDVEAREGPPCDESLRAEIDECPQWRLPDAMELHSLATDSVSRGILAGGVLYPCQAIFLGAKVLSIPGSMKFAEALPPRARDGAGPPFCIVRKRGVAIAREISKTQLATLKGLLQVVQRLDESAPILYIPEAGLAQLLSQDVYRYQQRAEQNAAGYAPGY